MLITNKYNLPQALVDAVKGDEHERNEFNYGVTTLLRPVREVLLERRHSNEIELDVSDCINKLFGTAFHSLIEKHDKTGMSELELEQAVIDNYKLVGRLDLYNEEQQAVIDYKTATCWKIIYKDFEDWRKQGLMYAWLCYKRGLVVKQIIFYAFLKDWTARDKRQADLKNSYYPDAQVYTYTLNVTIDDLIEIEKWINLRFENLITAKQLDDDDIPPCSDEECWYTGDKYAVYNKVTDSKAQRVFDTKQEAQDYVTNKGGVVVYRKGQYRKCQDYCEVCNFCKYYNERGGK